jgi:hypothetical protein
MADRFIPPLGLSNPPLKWKAFAAACIVLLPFGGVALIGYCLWCRLMERKERKHELEHMARRG